MKTTRINSIDQFRGFAILTMVLSNFMGGINIIPSWLKHAPDIGLTVNDLIAPLFIFAISLTFGLSFRRRKEHEGSFKTYNQFFTRYLAISGLGAIISAFETTFSASTKNTNWGVLQAIGVAGLITLMVIQLPAVFRGLIGLGLLAGYQILLDRYWLSTVLDTSHGGVLGSLSWAAMLILATILADIFHDAEGRRKYFVWFSFLVLLAGIGLSFLTPVSKNRVSFSYVFISLGVSGLIFFLFHWITEYKGMYSRALIAWGKNPLILYFLHYVLIGIVFLPGIPVLYAEAPLWLALIEIIILFTSLTAIAYWMERRQFIFSL